jgi:AraC-like DNA-binding protein
LETTEEQRLKEHKIDFLGVFLFPSHVEDLLNLELSSSTKKVDLNFKKLHTDQLFKSYRDSIEVLIENSYLVDEEMIATKIKEFVWLISKSQNMSTVDFLASMFKLNRTEFESTIKHTLYSSLSVDQMAKLCAMSISSFKRNFKETYQQSPKKYMASKKLEKASDLLKNSSDRISTIAYDCGYDTISTFNRSFKLSTGVSPSEFRLDQNA